MYRIVREEDKLRGKVLYYIEMQTGWFRKHWTRELGISGIHGPVGAPTLDGAKFKLDIIKSGEHIVKEIVKL